MEVYIERANQFLFELDLKNAERTSILALEFLLDIYIKCIILWM